MLYYILSFCCVVSYYFVVSCDVSYYVLSLFVLNFITMVYSMSCSFVFQSIALHANKFYCIAHFLFVLQRIAMSSILLYYSGGVYSLSHDLLSHHHTL